MRVKLFNGRVSQELKYLQILLLKLYAIFLRTSLSLSVCVTNWIFFSMLCKFMCGKSMTPVSKQASDCSKSLICVHSKEGMFKGMLLGDSAFQHFLVSTLGRNYVKKCVKLPDQCKTYSVARLCISIQIQHQEVNLPMIQLFNP